MTAADMARVDVPLPEVLAQLDPFEPMRARLPLDDPDRHALDTTTDRQFAALAAQGGNA